MKAFAALIICILTSQTVFAKRSPQPQFGPAPFPIQVAVLRTFGAGCPDGSVSATLSPDQTTVSILFDKLATQLPAGPAPAQESKSCTIVLGVKSIGQYRVAIVGSDVRGYANVPAGSRSSISIKHAGIFNAPKDMSHMNFKRDLVGPVEENIEMANRFPHKPLWSDCGSQQRYNPNIFPFMNITIDINSVNQNEEQDLIAAIDSLDYSGSPLVYHVAWIHDTRSCPR